MVKPAEAEAERVRILAVADAEKMKIQAEAAASHGRVALDKALIDQLPDIVEKAARGLANANVTVLNGAEGLSRGGQRAGRAGQGDLRRAAGHRRLRRRRKRRTADRHQLRIRLDQPNDPLSRLPDNGGGRLAVV